MAQPTHIPMTHPLAEEPWACPIRYAGHAKAKGWRPVDGDDADLIPDDVFDPAEHNVEEVQDYLAEADPGETERVLALERAGKNRSTITGD